MYDQIELVLIPLLDAGVARMTVRREKGQWTVSVSIVGNHGDMLFMAHGATMSEAMAELNKHCAVM